MPARARTALIGAGLSSVLLGLVWLLAFHTGLGERADQSILQGFAGLQRPRVNGLATFVARLCDGGPFIVLGGGIIAMALASRRHRVALAVVVLLVGANVTTELLKPLLAAPRTQSLLGTSIRPGVASWPSGHATAAMSLALGLVLAAPARRRPVAAAVGALFAVAVSYSFLTLGWHYPSDVLGGFLVAVTWAQLVVAAVAIAGTRRAERAETPAARPVPVRTALAAPAVAVAGAAIVAGLVALVRPHRVLAYASEHTAFVVGAAAIALLAFAVSIAVMLNARQ